jgi:hypothetical protein
MPEQQSEELSQEAIWRLQGRFTHPETGEDHCPGGCYKFYREPEHPLGKLHVPANMFWGHTPWAWFSEKP